MKSLSLSFALPLVLLVYLCHFPSSANLMDRQRLVKLSGKDYADAPAWLVWIRDLSQQESITEISLERTRCYGPCPIYKVILRRDGLSTYRGMENVKLIGKYEGRINTDAFDRLAEFLISRGFFSLMDKYLEGWMVQDIPTITTSVVRGGERKNVERRTLSDQDPIAASVELIEIEKAIKTAVERIVWARN